MRSLSLFWIKNPLYLTASFAYDRVLNGSLILGALKYPVSVVNGYKHLPVIVPSYLISKWSWLLITILETYGLSGYRDEAMIFVLLYIVTYFIL